jgi:brefeldin A-inhibited guanine nucleotide-exchange protein
MLFLVAHFNMDRIRVVWSRVWVIIAEHFIKVSCDDNKNIAIYAVDSLKQLATKFLEKDELANYHFQKVCKKQHLCEEKKKFFRNF